MKWKLLGLETKKIMQLLVDIKFFFFLFAQLELFNKNLDFRARWAEAKKESEIKI